MSAGAIPARVISGKTRPIGRLPLGGLLAVVAIWFLGMGGAATIVRPDAVVGFGPPSKMIPAVISSDGSLLDAGRFTVAARTGRTTVQSLTVHSVDADRGLLLIKGAVPGAAGGLILVRSAAKAPATKEA